VADRVSIRFVSGPLSGQTFSIGPGELFYIGSDPDCGALVSGDPAVAGRHVCIYYRAPGKILIKDLGSSSGSRINGKALGRTSKLRAGDRVTVGMTSTFQCSVWDPLQPSRMTMALKRGLSSMNRIRYPKVADLSWHPGNRLRTASAGVMAGLALALGVFTATGILEKRHGARGVGGGDIGAKVELRALTPVVTGDTGAQPGKGAPPRDDEPRRIELDRDFIWDEIVNISVRFGETPPSAMDQKFLDKVQGWISRFTARGYHRELLRRREQHAGAIETALRSQNLPVELGYLVWIESAYDIKALSPAGARGLWQLMPATAREYGLQVDPARKVDERTDPGKSSMAAAAYLNVLMRMFGSQRYLLAIASYNTGQNRVQRFQIATTIQRSRVADFWHLVDQLPAETVDYVPKFLAAVIVARNPDRF